IGDDEGGIAMLEDIGEPRPAQLSVHRNPYRACSRNAEDRRQRPRAVAHHHSDALAAPDTTTAQPAGHSRGHPFQSTEPDRRALEPGEQRGGRASRPGEKQVEKAFAHRPFLAVRSAKNFSIIWAGSP